MGMNREKQSSGQSETKKAYRSPRLVVYGNLRTLTSQVKGGGKGDGGDGRPTFNTRA